MSTPEAAVRVPISTRAREMKGPSALGGGWRRFVHLTWIIGLTEYRLTYFGSVLGYLWALMRPLLLFGVLYVVFSQIVKFGGDIPNYPMLLLFNIVLFSFFQDSTQRAVTAVVDSEAIVRKMHFPRLVIPLSTVLTGVLNLLLSLVAVFVFILAYGIDPMWTWLLLPVILVPLITLTSAVAMLVSSLYVRFRDVQPIWFVVSMILFYGYAGAVRDRHGAGQRPALRALQPDRDAARAGAQVGHRPDGARLHRGDRRLEVGDGAAGDLHRRVRAGPVGVQPRGPRDRGAAVGARRRVGRRTAGIERVVRARGRRPFEGVGRIAASMPP